MHKKTWSNSLSVSTVEEKYEHSFIRIALIATTILTFLVSFVLNILFATSDTLFGYKLFGSNLRTIYAQYQTHLTPSEWFYYLWVFVFIWQLVWLVYGFSTIFRKSTSDYLYKYPPVMHWLVYLNFSIANILYVVCLIFWSRKMFIFASCYSILVFIGLYIATFTSFFKLSDYQREMYYTEKTRDVWSIRFLVQNGIYLYATWSFIVFLITLDLTLVYQFNVTKQISHIIILGILFVKLLIYFLVENFISYNYCKFIFTPWLVYGIYLYNTIMRQTSIRNEANLKHSKLMDLVQQQFNGSMQAERYELTAENDFTYFKLNVYFFLHTCLLAVFLFLLLAKIFKFVWSEFCHHKNISL